jgi:hypothetical protein
MRRNCSRRSSGSARAATGSNVFDQQLRSRFDWLREPDPDAIATPPIFIRVFDLLHRDGRDLTGRPLRERRARLEDAVARQRPGPPGATARAERLRGVVGGGRARLRGLGCQGRDEPVRGGAHAPPAQGEAEGWTVEEDRWQRRISARAER